MAWYYSFEAKEIQNYILKSDKLREMVGASELVAQLCDGFLKEALQAVGVKDPDAVIIANAAGWARLLFEHESPAREFAAYWPLLVSRYAPGLKLVQTLVPLDAPLPEVLQKGMRELRAKRNQNQVLLPEATPLVERSPRTGGAAVITRFDRRAGGTVPLDRETARKRKMAGLSSLVSPMAQGLPIPPYAWPYEIEEIASDKSAYVAVIHADGNDLGSTLMRIREHLQKHPDQTAEVYRSLSRTIERITVGAVREATATILLPDFEKRTRNSKTAAAVKMAARPIVLGGDDLTIIVRADLALAFTAAFLTAFEQQSRSLLAELRQKVPTIPEQLTACAGVALIKKSYPFSAAYRLAETLCSFTKKEAKADRDSRSSKDALLPVPSSFAWHRITTALSDRYEEVQRTELTGRGLYDNQPVRFWYGPYGVGEQTGDLPKFNALLELTQALSALPGGSIRSLLSTLHTDPVTARKDFERILEVAEPAKGTAFRKALEQLTRNPDLPLWDQQYRTPLAEAYLAAELQKGAPRD